MKAGRGTLRRDQWPEEVIYQRFDGLLARRIAEVYHVIAIRPQYLFDPIKRPVRAAETVEQDDGLSGHRSGGSSHGEQQ